MSGCRALRRAAPLAAGAEQTRGERDEATRLAPAGEAGARMEPLNVARERQARSKENNPKPSAKKWARIYESLVSLRLDKSAIVDKAAIAATDLIKRPLLLGRPLQLAGLDKAAIGFDKTATGRP